MISIPIARSINPDDSVDLTRLSYLHRLQNWLILDGSWTGLKSIGRSFQDNRGCESASKEPEAADWPIFPHNILALVLRPSFNHFRQNCERVPDILTIRSGKLQ